MPLFSNFLSEKYFVHKRQVWYKRTQTERIKFVSVLKINFKKIVWIFNFHTSSIYTFFKFEKEFWSFISFNGERSENDQKIFYFGILVRKNSIFHDKFNHIFHFSVRWLFNEILKLFYSFKFWAWENFGVVTLCLRSLCSTSLSAWYLTLRRRMLQTR